MQRQQKLVELYPFTRYYRLVVLNRSKIYSFLVRLDYERSGGFPFGTHEIWTRLLDEYSKLQMPTWENRCTDEQPNAKNDWAAVDWGVYEMSYRSS